MVSLLDVLPTVLDWYDISYPKYHMFGHKSKPVELTGSSLLPVMSVEPSAGWDTIYASHNLHEVTMYYPMRVIRTKRYKLIRNLNYKMPFPIDQDFYISGTFQDLLKRTQAKEPLHWSKTLAQYYYRDPWELYDLKYDPQELSNIVLKESYANIVDLLQTKLVDWQNMTSDPWLCAPVGVLEDSGLYKSDPRCMPLYNKLK